MPSLSSICPSLFVGLVLIGRLNLMIEIVDQQRFSEAR